MSFSFRMVNPPAPDPSYEPLFPDAPDLYQVNNHGMNILYSFMSSCNLLDEDCSPPDFDVTLPDWLEPERVDEIMDALEFGQEPSPPLTAKEREALEVAKQMQAELLQVQSPTEGKIPAFKFETNDGWVVTSEECKSIVAAVAKVRVDPKRLEQVCSTDEAKSVLHSWGGFVEVAERTGGFIVK